MSARDALPRARQLLRLRDAACDAAERALGAAQAALELARDGELAALQGEKRAEAGVGAARARLAAEPGPACLACLGAALDGHERAVRARIEAVERRAAAEDAVIAARAALLRARARRDAMGERATTLRREVARGVEARVVAEAEDVMAARRNPA